MNNIFRCVHIAYPRSIVHSMQHSTGNDDHLKNGISSLLWTCPRVEHISDSVCRFSLTENLLLIHSLMKKMHKHTPYLQFVYSIWSAAAQFLNLVVCCTIFLIVHSVKPDVKIKRSNRKCNVLYGIQTKFFYIICVNHSFARAHTHKLTLSVCQFYRVYSLHITSHNFN